MNRLPTYSKMRQLCGLRIAAVWAFALLPLAQPSSFAEESRQPPASLPSFRRVFVPGAAPESWPLGNQRYLPVRDAEFHRLLEQAAAANHHEESAAARFSGAAYRVEMQSNGLLVGKAEQRVELPGGQPRLLSLEPMGAAITSAHWQRTPTEQALVGSWYRSSVSNPEFAVLVERPGTLVLDWQQGPHTALPGRNEYLLAFPPAVPAELELLLPSAYTPTVDQGKLTTSKLHPEDMHRWLANLAPGGTTKLTIERNLPFQQAAPLPRASLSTDYRLDSKGLNFEITVSLDTRVATTESLRFALTGSARITAARVDGNQAPWHLREGTEDEFVVPLTEQSCGEHQVVVRGVAPLQTDGLWRLPTLSPLGVFWTSGTASLFVSPALQLRSLHPEDASLQHIVGINEDHQNGEAYRLLQWTKQAALGVIVQRSEPRTESQLIHVLNLGEQETTGRTIASLSTTGQALFQIEAKVASGWEIGSIEIEPALTLGSWRINRSGDQAVAEIQLLRPLQVDQPLRLQIDGRWNLRKPFMPTTLGHVPLVRLRKVANQRQLLVLQTTNQGPVKLTSELERAQLDLDQLDSQEAALLDSLGKGPVLDMTLLAASTPVEVIPQPARYEVDVHADLRILPESFQHRLRFEVQPTRGAVSELMIRFQNPLPESVSWKLIGQEHAVAVEIVSSPERSAANGSAGFTYRVRLPEARAKPFEIAAHYQTAQPDAAKCEALTLPEAARWQGWITIHGPLQGAVVESRGCLPVGPTASSDPFHQSLSLLGRYRMDSYLALHRQRTPLVRRETLPHTSTSESVFAWFADYTTILEPNGTSTHVASYSLENQSASDAEIRLPEGATLQTAWENENRVEPIPVAGLDRAYRFPLSNHPGYSSITVRYTTVGPVSELQTALTPSRPTCSFGVRRGKWTLWTSQQYALREINSADTTERMGWFARLFGPLARNPSQRIFQPFSAQHWQELWSTPLETHHSRRSAQRLEKQLAELLAAEPLRSWSNSLLAVLVELDLLETVLVDQAALATQGVEATTPTGTTGAPDFQPTGVRSSGVALSGIALVASPGTITLTTTDRVAQWRNQLHRIGDSHVYRTKLGSLATRLNRPKGTRSGKIVPATLWEAASKLHQPSWRLPSAPSLAAAGWRARTFEFVDSGPTLVVYRIASRRALRSAVWLLATVLGACWLGRKPGWLVGIGSLSAALSLVVSPEAVALPQAVFLGTLAAVGLRTLRKVLSDNTAFRTAGPARPLVTLLLLAALFAVHGYQPASADTPRTVFYPIDEQGRLQGEDIFVSESFLSELNRLGRHSAYDGATCVLLQAKIRGALPSAISDQPAKAPPWSISLVAKSFVPGCRWNLPLHRSDVDWLEGKHLLDGVPVQLQWDKKGRSCDVVLAEPGMHRLELRFAPRYTKTSSTAQMNLHIPPLAGAVLELEAPANLDNLRVASAGPLQPGEQPLHFQTKLSATNQLQIEWTMPSEIEKEQLIESVEQLAWLQITPSSARLEVKFRIDSAESSPRSLLLKKPPSLKLLPLDEASSVESWQLLPGNPAKVLLILKPALGNQFDMVLPFQLERATAVGNLDYPEVRLQGVVPTRNWFAVSVSAGLSYEAQESASFRPIVAKEFALQWFDSPTLPLFAYSVEDLSRDWSLRIWPDPSSMIAKQSMQVEAHQEGLHVLYEAFVDKIAGSWLVHRLKVPRTLRVDSVSVSVDSSDDTIPTRWIRNGEEQIVLFCGRPIQEPQTIRLRGSVDSEATGAAEDRTVPMPTVWLQSATRDSTLRVDLIRRPEVLVAWKNLRHKLPETPREGFLRHDAHLLVDRYVLHEGKLAGDELLQISPNRPLMSADTILSLDQPSNELTATLAARVTVQQGVLGRLQVSAPANWHEPWEVTPVGSGVIGKLLESPRGNSLEVLLTKPLHVGESLDVKISGVLELPSDQRLKVPDLRLADAVTKRRYVLLPSKLAGRSIAWRVEGMKHETLAGELASLSEGNEDKLPFRVMLDRFSVRERIQDSQLRQASLRHLAVRGVVDGDGVWTGTAEILLQPGMATHCALQLPVDSEMVQIWVGDQQVRTEKVLAKAEGPTRWRISLGPLYLPQRITVSYTSRPKIAGGHISLTPPLVLIGDQTLPTPPTSWHVQPIGGAVPGDVQLGRRISAKTFSQGMLLARWKVLASACPAALQLPTQESRPWFLAWQSHLRQVSAELRFAQTLQSIEAGDKSGDAGEKFSEAWNALAKHLGEEATAEVEQSSVPPKLLAGTPPAINHREFFLQSKAAEPIQLQWGRPAWYDVGQTLLALVLACGGVLLCWRSSRAARWSVLLSRRHHQTAIVSGLFWWLLLQPSLLGLLVVAVACLDWLQQKAARRSASGQPNPSGISDISTSLTRDVL